METENKKNKDLNLDELLQERTDIANILDKEILKLDKLLFGKLSGLNHTYRFSGQKKLRNQSVAEHSYWTALISVALARYENEMRKKFGLLLAPLNIEYLYDICMLHDVDEVMTGDINHRFKHSEYGENFRNSLKELLLKTVRNVLFKDTLSEDYLYNSWEKSHEDNEYTYLLKIGDWLQLLQYSVEEVELGNSKFNDKILRVLNLIQNKNNLFLERYYKNRKDNSLFFVPVLINKFLNYFYNNKMKKGL